MIEGNKTTTSITLVRPEAVYRFARSKYNSKAANYLIQNYILSDSEWLKKEDFSPRVLAKHLELGGLPGKPDSAEPVKTALRQLSLGKIIVRSHVGHYALADSTVARSVKPIKEKRHTKFKAHLRIEKTIGTGPECVYVYLNTNDRALAACEGRRIYECKTGYSKKKNPRERILEQIGTAISRFPVVGLAIDCPDANRTEAAIHKVLELAKCDYPERCGSEWFLASPEIVEFIWDGLYNKKRSPTDVARDVVGKKSSRLRRFTQVWMIIKVLILGFQRETLICD